MEDRRYMVGERVLASRDQSGQGHEEGTVYDFYELLINEDKIPQVVVDFDDGQRVLMVAREPNIKAIEEDHVTDDIDDDEFDEEAVEDGDDEETEPGDDDDWDSADDE